MQHISDSTVHRLSRYYRTLKALDDDGARTVSSDALAQQNGVTLAQVRKDLSYFGAFGRRGLGYSVPELRKSIGKILGLDRTWKVALVGVGNIGRALLDYDQFRTQGFQITIAFDSDPAKVGRIIHGISVRAEANIQRDVEAEGVNIAVLAVPPDAAQRLVDSLVAGGVKAILNFAPVNIEVPSGVHIRHENMAIEIESLSFALRNPKMAKKG